MLELNISTGNENWKQVKLSSEENNSVRQYLKIDSLRR